MSVDAIRFCLARATDATAFEHLCCDVLSCDGFESVEPIGGTSDGGRDALHTARDSSKLRTICAFSLRKDWKTKLRQDCERVRELGHKCDQIVFAFTTQPTPAERDKAIQHVKDNFDWDLVLYGLERMRTQLAGRSNHLLNSYRSIFYPRFFQAVAGHIVEKEHRDLIIIDHVIEDSAVALWLARRLEVSGYNVCGSRTAPFLGLDLDEAVRELISSRAAKYIPILSTTAANDVDLRGRCEHAASVTDCLLPLVFADLAPDGLSNRIQKITPVSFGKGWAAGLNSLLSALDKQDVAKSWGVESGRVTAIDSIIPEPLTADEPEELFSNAFRVNRIPDCILTVPLTKKPNPAQLQHLREHWAFVLVGETAFSFHHPPVDGLIDTSRRFAESMHAHERNFSGRRTRDVIVELIRRCMELSCYRTGMKWCPDRELIYFPRQEEDSRMIPFLDTQGKKRRTGVTGKKSLFRPGQENEVYRYFVSPKFFASGSPSGDNMEVRLRLRVRVTDEGEKPFSGRAVITRRKAATKGWFNQHWFAKTLATIQHISTDGAITVGAGDRLLSVSSSPKTFICPISIDSAAVQRMMSEQKESRDRLKEELESENE